MPKGDDRDRPGSILYDNGVYVFYTQYSEESVDGAVRRGPVAVQRRGRNDVKYSIVGRGIARSLEPVMFGRGGGRAQPKAQADEK